MQIREESERDEVVIAELYVSSRQAAWDGLVDEAYLDALDVESEGRDLHTHLAPRDAGWRVLLAEEDARVVGFVTFVSDRVSRVGHIGALFVSPDRFRSGIGTSLLDAATAALADSGCDEAILWMLEEDRDLMGFYRNRGWQPDGGRQTIELDRSRTAIRLRKAFSSF
jgi:GNAT superfamily N-acetyltransferase